MNTLSQPTCGIPKRHKAQPISPTLWMATCALSILSSVAHAGTFDLQQAWNAAQTNDATYLASIAQNEVYDAQKSQARSVILPTIRVTGGIYKTRTQFLVNPKSSTNTRKTPGNIAVSLNQPILALDKLTGFKQVSQNAQIGQLELAQARQDLISRVIQTYFSAWLAQRNLDIAQSVAKAAEKQYAVALKNFEVGNTTVIDSQEAETILHNAKAAVISAQGAADNAQSQLEFLVGRPITEPLAAIKDNLKLKMPVPDTVQSWIERAKTSNHTIKMAQLRYQMADLETTRIWQQRLPQISIVASKRWSSTDFKTSAEERTGVSTIGLELSVPIFDGGLITAQEREAQAKKTMSFQSLRATQNSIAQGTRAAYNQAVGGLASINALSAAQNAASKSFASNKLGYDLGMRINIDVTNAQNTYAQAQYNLAQAQYNTIMGNVNLKSAIGELNEDDITYINALLNQNNHNNNNNNHNKPADATKTPTDNAHDSVKENTSVPPKP